MNTVITYIFGKNKELLREPLVIDNSIEYICITDQKDLKSKTWKIIYDDIPQAKCDRDKMVYVKYNPFKYTSAEKICVIDGSLEIKSSLIPLFEQSNNIDLLVKKHPVRHNLIDEINEWIKYRNMPKIGLTKFQKMAEIMNIDLSIDFLLESCVILYNRNKNTKELCEEVLSYMTFLSENDKLFLSNQCVLTFLLMINKNKYSYIKQQVYFNRYLHNTNKVNIQ